MTTITRDRRLTDALAALYGYLRLDPQPFLEDARDAAAESLLEALGEHLRRDEDHLFPDLGASFAAAGDALQPLREEHESLRLFASELAPRLAVGDLAGAAAVAASMISALFAHLEREAEVVRALLERLHPGARDRLLRRMGLHREEDSADS